MSNKLCAAANRILDLCWPRHCFVCGEHAGCDTVCSHCVPLLPWLYPGQTCPQCALPVPCGAVCGRCLRRTPDFDATLAIFAYATPIREMVLAIKHGNGFARIDWLAAMMAQELARSSLRPDLIVPMPLHPTRLAQRGFNQSAELARRVGRVIDVPLRLDLLVRDINTPRLEGLRQKERLRAVRGAFRCRERLGGAHVLVVDDVMTSGATLNELARTLKSSGAGRVSNLVAARTLRQPAR